MIFVGKTHRHLSINFFPRALEIKNNEDHYSKRQFINRLD